MLISITIYFFQIYNHFMEFEKKFTYKTFQNRFQISEIIIMNNYDLLNDNKD